jgi:SNF2 family DNA or RNA helicase
MQEVRFAETKLLPCMNNSLQAGFTGFKSLQDEEMKFLILDETHLIKKLEVSEMAKSFLNFNSKRCVLLTGTPPQSDLVELRPLMYFFMPHIFQSHQEFNGWFSNSR